MHLSSVSLIRDYNPKRRRKKKIKPKKMSQWNQKLLPPTIGQVLSAGLWTSSGPSRAYCSSNARAIRSFCFPRITSDTFWVSWKRYSTGLWQVKLWQHANIRVKLWQVQGINMKLFVWTMRNFKNIWTLHLCHKTQLIHRRIIKNLHLCAFGTHRHEAFQCWQVSKRFRTSATYTWQTPWAHRRWLADSP